MFTQESFIEWATGWVHDDPPGQQARFKEAFAGELAKWKPRSVNVVINGDNQEFPAGDVNYAEVVSTVGYNPSRILSVVYHVRLGGDSIRQGSLFPGKSVEVSEGMIFNVADTGSS